MINPHSLLAQLPALRKGLGIIQFVAGLGDFLTSIILLAYQLALTTGFNRVVPSLVVTSFLTSSIPLWFIYSKPFAIRLPISSAQQPKAGSKRDKVAKFTRSIMFELICLGGVGAWTLITVIDLHAETPGLIDNCGGWTICRMLLAVLAFTWISFLFQSLSFASLLLSTLYFSIRRSSPIPTLFTSFSEVDWIRYSGRPVNRSATIKRVKQSKQNTSTVPEDSPNFAHEEELKAPSKGRFEGRDSQVPVLAKSIHSYGGSIGGGGDDSFTVDWDGQSAFTERNGFRDSTATGMSARDQVFILVTEGEKEEEGEEKEKREVENGNVGTGTAM